jgi:hypothetical protein
MFPFRKKVEKLALIGAVLKFMKYEHDSQYSHWDLEDCFRNLDSNMRQKNLHIISP